MAEDLCRGWTEPEVEKAVQQATPLARRILRTMAQNRGITAQEIAEKLNLKSMNVVAGSLASWYVHVTKPLGVKSPKTGKDSWPFYIRDPDPNAEGRNYRYEMPLAVADIVLRHIATDV